MKTIKVKAKFFYSCEYEADALSAIEDELKACNLKIENLQVLDSHRACRNAYGKTLSEEEFENIDPLSDEAWFDDYDFVLEGSVYSRKIQSKEEIVRILKDETSFMEEIAS